MKFGYIAQYMDYVEKRQNRRLVLFGAGGLCAHILSKYFILEKVEFICDNNQSKWGQDFFGVKICSPAKLADTPDGYVIVVCIKDSYAYYSVCSQLKQMGVNNHYKYNVLYLRSTVETYDSPWVNGFKPYNTYQIINRHNHEINEVRSWLSDEKSIYVYDSMVIKMKYMLGDYSDICDIECDYFYNEGIFEYTEDEILADVGCYDGTTSIQFSEMLGKKFKKTMFFEPDNNNYLRSVNNISKHIDSDKYVGFKMGLSNKNGTVGFSHIGGEGSRINDNVGLDVKIARFDDLVSINERVTFIKLDVEGEELNVLRGMQKSIQTHRPKLAISIYHKTEDLWVLPQFVKFLVPEYRLFIRHHGMNMFGKVLYATI